MNHSTFVWRTPVLAIAAACALALLVVCARGAGAVAAAHAQHRNAFLASCATSSLVIWLDTNGDGAAGSFYYRLEFTNLAPRACSIGGYPGISAVDLAGRRLGSPGSRTASRTPLLTLRTGATATATLRVVQALDFPAPACHPVSAAGVRVYPPNQTASKIVPFPFEACSRTGPGILSVQAVA